LRKLRTSNPNPNELARDRTFGKQIETLAPVVLVTSTRLQPNSSV